MGFRAWLAQAPVSVEKAVIVSELPPSMCGCHPRISSLVVVNKDKSGFALSRAQLLPEQALPPGLST